MTEELQMKKNVKLYPIYKAFAWDLLFYYAIFFLFLTQEKGLSASEVLFADAFYPIFKFFSSFISINISEFFGSRKTILVGNIFVCASILVLIFSNSIEMVILSNLIMAIGYDFKGLCEPSFLYDSIPNVEKKRDIFSKIDSKGSTIYYFLDAISAFFTGFLFVVNAYLPMIICFIFTFIAIFISFSFYDAKPATVKSKGQLKTHFKGLKHAFKYVFKSNRLKCLLVFAALFSSVLSVFKTYMNSLLVDLAVPSQYFGIITGVLQVISAVSAKFQYKYHKKFKNKLLTYFSLPFLFIMLLTSICIACGLNFYFIISVFAIMCITYALVKGPYYTLIKRYLNSFSSPTLSNKIYSAASMVENIVRAFVYMFSSFLLGITNTATSLILFACLMIIIFIFLLEIMKNKVGLKPEEYSKKEIEFIELN